MTLQEIENKCCELEEKVRALQARQRENDEPVTIIAKSSDEELKASSFEIPPKPSAEKTVDKDLKKYFSLAKKMVQAMRRAGLTENSLSYTRQTYEVRESRKKMTEFAESRDMDIVVKDNWARLEISREGELLGKISPRHAQRKINGCYAWIGYVLYPADYFDADGFIIKLGIT